MWTLSVTAAIAARLCVRRACDQCAMFSIAKTAWPPSWASPPRRRPPRPARSFLHPGHSRRHQFPAAPQGALEQKSPCRTDHSDCTGRSVSFEQFQLVSLLAGWAPLAPGFDWRRYSDVSQPAGRSFLTGEGCMSMSHRVRCNCHRCVIRGLMGPAVVVTVGVLFLLDQLRGGYLSFGNTFPVILIVIGVIS